MVRVRTVAQLGIRTAAVVTVTVLQGTTNNRRLVVMVPRLLKIPVMVHTINRVDTITLRRDTILRAQDTEMPVDTVDQRDTEILLQDTILQPRQFKAINVASQRTAEV